MAWRSSGSNNDELVDNLKRFQVIESVHVEDGFRLVDRVHFVPRCFQDLAYTDQPLRKGNVHISAPHIYGGVLEALDMKKDAGLTFLNAGSGTGYLACIAASILGPRSFHHCVEVSDEVVGHCEESIKAWKQDLDKPQKVGRIKVYTGNAFQIDSEKGEAALGFDRIYVGASIGRASLDLFKKLLKPEGILVAPVEDELVKIVKLVTSQDDDSSEQFAQSVVSCVHFAPLRTDLNAEVVIPARVWGPSEHYCYPQSFHDASKTVMLCSHAKLEQPPKPQPREVLNAARLLPPALWIEVMSFAHRDWFKTPQSETEMLLQQLEVEKAKTEKANIALLDAEQRCAAAEKERDIYRMLARRWRSRLTTTFEEDIEIGPDNMSTLSRRMSQRHFLSLLADESHESVLGREMSEDDSDISDSSVESNSDMEEDDGIGNSTSVNVEAHIHHGSGNEERRQLRTVSISGEETSA